MDDPSVPREELAKALKFIRRVNQRLGGQRALLGHLRVWSRSWPRNRAITLLDIGTGSADLPVSAVRWARTRGFDLRVTAIDVHDTTLELAREYLRGNPGEAGNIELVKANALELMSRYEPGSFDYVHAGMFLHHLSGLETLTMLRIMDRLARAGLIWNDLVRSRIALAAAKVLTAISTPMIRHDATASVRAGFIRSEVLDIARRLELGHLKYRQSVLAQRFTLAGERKGAW